MGRIVHSWPFEGKSLTPGNGEDNDINPLRTRIETIHVVNGVFRMKRVGILVEAWHVLPSLKGTGIVSKTIIYVKIVEAKKRIGEAEKRTEGVEKRIGEAEKRIEEVGKKGEAEKIGEGRNEGEKIGEEVDKRNEEEVGKNEEGGIIREEV